MIKTIDFINCPICMSELDFTETNIRGNLVECEIYCSNCNVEAHAINWPEAYRKFNKENYLSI